MTVWLSTTHPWTTARPDRPTRTTVALVVAAFGALAVMVGRDGTLGWRAVRVVLVAVLAAATVVALSRLRRRGRGTLATAVGIVAVAIGIGFLPFVLERPVSLLSLAALVALVGGLALVATGTVVRTRGRRWIRRAVAGLATLIATVIAAMVIGPAVVATNVPRPAIGATPARVDLAYEDVTLTAADGVELAAWYVPSANRAAVVLRHGAGSTRSDVLDEAAVLARHGFGVLLVDARGHGDSEGRAMDFGWYGDLDIAAATRFLAGRDDVDPRRIGIVGSSMGGEEAIGASATDELIGAVVAEGATARTAADKAWLSDEYGVRGLLQEQVERAQYWLTDALTEARPPVALHTAVVRSERTPYLLITAGNAPDEWHAATFIAGAASDRVQVWNVPGADHTDGLAVAPDEWETRVVEFLTDALDIPTG